MLYLRDTSIVFFQKRYVFYFLSATATIPDIAPITPPSKSSQKKSNEKLISPPIVPKSKKAAKLIIKPKTKPFISPLFSLTETKTPKNTETIFNTQLVGFIADNGIENNSIHNAKSNTLIRENNNETTIPFNEETITSLTLYIKKLRTV